MKKIIVTTSIHPVTEAIEKYDRMEGWELIVTGDVKTPNNYNLKHGTFISWEQQKKEYMDICEIVGPNSWPRGRMIAFIEAYKRGADVVATIDDDNIPLENWGKDIAVGKEIEATMFSSSNFAFDPLYVVENNKDEIWFRGFPLELLHERKYTSKKVTITPKVQQNLWLGDPDVDAICRIVYKPRWEEVKLVDKYFCSDAYSPFDTQNTILLGSVLKDFFCIPFIGRHDDIWGAYLFETVHPASVVYGEATVRQERIINPDYHSLSKDLDNERIGNRDTYKLLELLNNHGLEEGLSILPSRSRTAREIYRSYFH